MSKETTVNDLIIEWDAYESSASPLDRYCVLAGDLYTGMNPAGSHCSKESMQWET